MVSDHEFSETTAALVNEAKIKGNGAFVLLVPLWQGAFECSISTDQLLQSF
jgi:hypothetical protein